MRPARLRGPGLPGIPGLPGQNSKVPKCAVRPPALGCGLYPMRSLMSCSRLLCSVPSASIAAASSPPAAASASSRCFLRLCGGTGRSGPGAGRAPRARPRAHLQLLPDALELLDVVQLQLQPRRLPTEHRDRRHRERRHYRALPPSAGPARATPRHPAPPRPAPPHLPACPARTTISEHYTSRRAPRVPPLAGTTSPSVPRTSCP